MTIRDLIQKGRTIEEGLKYVLIGDNLIRTFDEYELANVDEYYNWKEWSIRFLHLYSPTDVDRFTKYSEDFEKHYYNPRYISNMIGVLEACKAMPTEKMNNAEMVQDREKELAEVEKLEELYLKMASKETIHLSTSAFHNWHAAACVLFDKWFYPTDDDWVKFQSIEGDGNGYILNHYFDMIYSPYRKLMARLKDGRALKGISVRKKNTEEKRQAAEYDKINIFISYSHADEEWLKRLSKHLKVLAKYSGNVEYWEDTKLRGGDKWREEIINAISRANVAILLISTDFLASDFISSDELPPILRKAEEEGTRVIPLIVSPCAYDLSEISEFQAINSPDKTLADMVGDDAAINRVYLELIKNIQELL